MTKINQVMKSVDPALLLEWPLWRLVLLDKVATLQELETTWNMDDLTRANVLLDIKAKCEEILFETEK